jgi:hypothetical protein
VELGVQLVHQEIFLEALEQLVVLVVLVVLEVQFI